jgi:hypothetical protein
MIWQSCDLFQCTNGACRSKVLVLEPPRSDSGATAHPRCICGFSLERVPHSVDDPMRTWTF